MKRFEIITPKNEVVKVVNEANGRLYLGHRVFEREDLEALGLRLREVPEPVEFNTEIVGLSRDDDVGVVPVQTCLRPFIGRRVKVRVELAE